jgi:3-hydroxyacyl-[acyl-carrier-protein] dehydratase
MLLLDRILDYECGVWATGLKTVTTNEASFNVERAGHGIMPAYLVLELMNQTSAMILLTDPAFKDTTPIVAGFEHARFRRPVTTGDRLIVHAELYKFKRNIGRIRATASVDGVDVAKVEIVSMLAPSEDLAKG